MADEWHEATLEQLGRIVTGKTPPTAQADFYGGIIPFVTPTDFDGRRIIESTGRNLTDIGADVVAGAQIPADAVMVSCIGSDMGKVALSSRESVTNQQINSIIVNDENDALFVYYNLSQRRAEIKAAAGGSAQPILNKTAFGLLDILLPPLHEQRAIAQILGTLDDRIEANRRMAATLEEMVRTLFRAWFVTFDPVRAKAEGRWRLGQTLPGLPASLYDMFPDHLVETEHGEAPVGWMEAKIGSVLERLKVGKLYDQKSSLSTGLVPILDQGKRGSIGFHNDEPNIVADPENRVCTFANHTCVLRLIDYSFSTIQNVIPFRGTAVPTEWIYYASEGKQEFEEYRGHWPSFVEHKIIVPPPQLASVFRDVVDPIVTRIAQNELHSRAIATIRDTLLPGLVSGKIRVKDPDAFLKVRGL